MAEDQNRNVSDEINSVLAQVEQRAKLRQAAKAAKATATLKAPDIKAAWQAAYAEWQDTYSGDRKPQAGAVCTTAAIAAFRNNYRRYFALGGLEVTVLFRDITERWPSISASLQWHRGLPATPDFGFVAYNLRRVVAALEDQGSRQAEGIGGGTDAEHGGAVTAPKQRKRRLRDYYE